MALSDAAFHHVGVSVRDMERAKDFYCGTLGFSVVWEHPDRTGEPLQKVVGLPGALMHITMVEGYGMRIELFQYIRPAGRDRGEQRQCDFGLIHFALKVKDARALYADLSARGVPFNSAPQDLRPGVVALYMRDPEGNTIEIMENNVD
jgi:catechol 2,3-dioxygenase-like lactoylglutathione lyase family enzyme